MEGDQGSDGFSSHALLLHIPLCLYCLFFLGLFVHVAPHAKMFIRRYARRHRVCGLLYLAWLITGLLDLANTAVQQDHYNQPHSPLFYFAYDVILGAVGIALTLSAAYDFSSHSRIKNPASGALDDTATVTQSEMIEHSFYQGLNLCQIIFIHSLGPSLSSTSSSSSLTSRLLLLTFVTSPWVLRSRFPVNSFSKNYIGQAPSLTRSLYRIKKYQYLLYKHFLLHGLNLSLTLLPQPQPHTSLSTRPYFRLYWLSLNAAYVLEFFLQTLVKKGAMQQGTMLALNQLLMVINTAPALQVLLVDVSWSLGLLSLLLNLINRGRDVENVLTLAILAITLNLMS